MTGDRLQSILYGFALAVACVFVLLNLPARIDRLGPIENSDWRQIYFHQEAAHDSWKQQKAPPFLSPYVNGGFPLASHPHDPSFSLLFPLSLALGPVRAVALNAMILFLAGVMGMVLLCRQSLGMDLRASLFAGMAMAVAGWYPARLLGGNYWELFYFLFPLALYLLERGRYSRRHLAGAALVFYLLFAEGNFAFPICIVFCGLALLIPGVFPKSGGKGVGRFAGLWALVLAVAGALALGAAKLYLLSGLLGTNARLVFYPDHKNVTVKDMAGLGNLFFEQLRVSPVSRQTAEALSRYQAVLLARYIGCGLPVAVFALWGLATRFRRALAIFFLFVLAAWLTESRYLPPEADLFSLLSHLPFFSSILFPVKYFNFFMLFFLCLLAAWGMDHLCNRARDLTVWTALALGLLSLAWPASQHQRVWESVFTHPPLQAQKQPEGFFQVNSYPLYFNLKKGIGVIDWNSSITIPTETVPRLLCEGGLGSCEENPAYPGEAYLAEGEGVALLEEISYNRIRVRVDSTGPALLVLNQNALPGWSASEGSVEARGGLLAVRFKTAGSRDLALSFRPPGFIPAGIASLAALLALFFLLVLPDRRNRSIPSPAAKPRPRPRPKPADEDSDNPG